jgi:Uma2 family endonuclease
MAQPLTTALDWRNLTQTLVTEDDEPVDNLVSAKQQRLLVESLYTSWQPRQEEDLDEPRPFLADANVGIFYARHQPPIVPDVFVSLDVEANPEWLADEHRAYFVWEFGKAPEVAVEIVSNRVGRELTDKLERYARMGIVYYIVFDPFHELGEETLRVYELFLGRRYRLREDWTMPELGLGLRLWPGQFEGLNGEWLRWRNLDGELLLTGKERSLLEAARANQEAARADQEASRANQEASRANQEASRAEQEAARAEQEAARAEQEAARAEQEAARAEQEAARADQEAKRADHEAAARQQAEDEIARLRAELQRLEGPVQ